MEMIRNFGLTFNKYMRENAKSLLIKYAALLGALCVLSLWIGYNYNIGDIVYNGYTYDRALSSELGIFTFLLVVFALVSASGTMYMMRSKESSLSTLMTPSPMLSKFLVAWIFNVPVAVALFICFSYAADYLRYLLYSSIAVNKSAIITPFSFEALGIPSEVIQIFFMFIIAGQAIFVLGSTIWPNKAVIKTVIASVVIFWVYAAFVVLGMRLSGPQISVVNNFLDEEPSMANLWVADIVFSLFIYAVAYFRFKESEIINRW